MEVMIPRRAGCRWEDFPAIFLGFIPWGYAWSFPGLETQTYGMAALSSRSGKKIKSHFGEFLASQSIEPAASSHIASHCIPYGNYARRPGSRRLLLLGDACGLADPLLGEGIYYAHRSAQLAARAVLGAIQDPDSLVPTYGRLLKERIFPELKYAALGRRIAFSLPKSWYYYFFLFMLRGNHRIVEETIQGKRSFRWFRPIDHGPVGGSITSRFSKGTPGALRPSRESNSDS
jgi:flavin-dependent dehydrogenase